MENCDGPQGSVVCVCKQLMEEHFGEAEQRTYCTPSRNSVNTATRLMTYCENILNVMGDGNTEASHLCKLMQSPKQDVSPSAVNDEEGWCCSGDSFSLYEWWQLDSRHSLDA